MILENVNKIIEKTEYFWYYSFKEAHQLRHDIVHQNTTNLCFTYIHVYLHIYQNPVYIQKINCIHGPPLLYVNAWIIYRCLSTNFQWNIRPFYQEYKIFIDWA